MEKKDFEKLVGKTFHAKDHKITLKLIKVEALKASGYPEQKREPFSLEFVGPGETHLPDDSYLLENTESGEQTIFISAFKKEKDGIHYDAVFN